MEWENFYGNVNEDEKLFVGMEMGMGELLRGQHGNGKDLMGMGWGWEQFYLPCHYSLFAADIRFVKK